VLPKGVAGLSCCTAPQHIDQGHGASINIQHLIDISAFALADVVFRMEGGYAAVGQVARRWQQVPSRILDPSANSTATAAFVRDILLAMDCSTDGA
jgi:hypothetical protein